MDRLFPERIVIYPRDVEILLSKCERSAQDFLRQIRVALNKPPGSFVTVREFCFITGMDEDEVREQLRKG